MRTLPPLGVDKEVEEAVDEEEEEAVVVESITDIERAFTRGRFVVELVAAEVVVEAPIATEVVLVKDEESAAVVVASSCCER